MQSLLRWVNKNRLEFLVVVLILLVSAAMRFYRLPEYMTFLGDEGRDVLIVKRILTTYDIPLIGPPTSIGNMYNGPLYYYMMSFAMAIFWLDPVAAAGMVALLGVITVGLVYYLARSWFGVIAGIVSSVLYSFSPVNIIYSRSSWNPNPAPFFSLLVFLGFSKAHHTRDFRWLILTGGAMAFAVQMHYLALVLIPIVVILWCLEVWFILKRKAKQHFFAKSTIVAIGLFLTLMSPLLVFDLKHNFMNYRAMSAFFGTRETTVNLNILNSWDRLIPLYTNNLIGRYIAAGDPILITIVALILIIPIVFLVYNFWKKKNGHRNISWPILIITLWMVGGIAGLSLYKQSIYDHYLTFFNPAPYLMIGSVFFILKFINSSKLQYLFKSLLMLLFFIILVFNIQKNPLLYSPNNQLTKTQQIANFIIEQSENKPFNFALIAEHNYDSAYQFYLDIFGHKPMMLPSEVSAQLFVVCEDAVCNPINHPKYEIAAFGWAQIERQKDFKGVKVFKLVHNPDQPK